MIDLLACPFMDSSGLKVLLVAMDDLGGRLALALSPDSPVASLLAIGGVGDRFSVHPTQASAVAALS